jgi:hypothetical protein
MGRTYLKNRKQAPMRSYLNLKIEIKIVDKIRVCCPCQCHGGLDGGITLRWVFRKWEVGVWIGSS